MIDSGRRRIVIASGEVLDVDATTHDDLFWACRASAGGSFGIRSSFVFDLVSVPEGDAIYFRFDWRGADAAKAVFSAFHQMLTNPTGKLNAVAMAQATPVGPKGPREAIDVMSRGHYLGPRRRAARAWCNRCWMPSSPGSNVWNW